MFRKKRLRRWMDTVALWHMSQILFLFTLDFVLPAGLLLRTIPCQIDWWKLVWFLAVEHRRSSVELFFKLHRFLECWKWIFFSGFVDPSNVTRRVTFQQLTFSLIFNGFCLQMTRSGISHHHCPMEPGPWFKGDRTNLWKQKSKEFCDHTITDGTFPFYARRHKI